MACSNTGCKEGISVEPVATHMATSAVMTMAIKENPNSERFPSCAR